MSKLNRAAQKFVRSYKDQYEDVEKAAKLGSELVGRLLKDTGVFVHVISSRAKKLDSLREKLRRKEYKNPSKQLTDLIGIRVITYYSDAVDSTVARLRQEFEINEKASVDKRQELGLYDFGYRTVQLIARLKKERITKDLSPLRKNWFEIQVRSVLDHAWAEIEHEVVYKSGIEYTEMVKRRFARLAGSLELLDNEFLALRGEREQLIEQYCESYKQNKDNKKLFDVARLLGFLEATRPEGQGWRSAPTGGIPLGAGLEVSCVEALKAAGLGTARSLRDLFRSSKFRYAITSFASSQGIEPAQVSHLAVVVIAVAIKDVGVVQHHFPEIIYDPAIASLIERRARLR